MEKVITLLKDLSAKVEKEGKKDAEQYDKFACFCKEQADDKLYAIEKSTAKIADLDAQIKALTAEIAELNGDISKLSKKVSNLESDIDTRTKKREGQHAKYEAKATDLNGAIASCEAAIEALKDSKGATTGKTSSALLALDNLPLPVAQAPGAVALLSKIKGAPKFQYQSNDIIATLEELLDTFKANKKDLDIEEFDTNSAFERTVLGLSNEKKFAEKEQAEKEALEAQKTETMETAKEDRSDEDADMASDNAFMKELTAQCEQKASDFDQRSTTRSDELTALSKATAELETGAAPNFEANSKLVGLQLNKASKVSSSPASFVQISSVQRQRSGQDAALERVRAFLVSAADRTSSRAIAAVAERVTLAEDHFVKVRGLIKDLLAKLKDDAKSEATQKGFCDKNMAKAIGKRDKANAQIEVANAKITSETANKEQLEDEINTLTKEIAELKKGFNEAQELRNTENSNNEQTIFEAKAGKASVDKALDVLNSFYKNAFLQKKYTPPKADRDGNTVGDLAPEIDQGTYHGSQGESKGIVGILEVIRSDFARTQKKTEDDEKTAVTDFETFEKDTNDDVDKKDKSIEKKEGEVKDAKAEILAQEQALKDAKALLDTGLQALEELEVMCVKGEETYAERVQKRNDEIAALKQAMTILDEWQN